MHVLLVWWEWTGWVVGTLALKTLPIVEMWSRTRVE